MNVVLADLRGREGFVTKDTVVGGYGSRFIPFTRVTKVLCTFKARFHSLPSVQMAYIAALLARWGHTVKFTEGEPVEGDLAIVLSSLVDYRQETDWADQMRARGMKVGFVGLTASKLPHLFESHADFVINGEPEEAIQRLARGEQLSGLVKSADIADLDSLPFPRWDLVTARNHQRRLGFIRPVGGGFPLLASRSCPEFCTYCPHRILSAYRNRSVKSIVDEMAHIADQYPRPYIIFRDPLFTHDRTRVLELCDEIRTRGLSLRFECETRLDRLDPALLDIMHSVGLRAISFGVESVSSDLLRRVGRRPTPEGHQRLIIEHCRSKRIATAAFFVLGFLEDDWSSIGATIEYATDLGPTVAQFKLLTPYPGTPLFKRMEKVIVEKDWQKFDGFTPTYSHPTLSERELKFLLGAAYTRFYMRPSYLADLWRIRSEAVREWLGRWDGRVAARHTREERAQMSRPVTC